MPTTVSEFDPALYNTKDNGQRESYLILDDDERLKGFVRPLRTSYIHVGAGPTYPLRDLTEQEKEKYAQFDYIKFEEYPEEYSPKTGRFWTQEQLDQSYGCGVETQIHIEIAETYARDPNFYGRTFCVGCGKHFPLEEFVWCVDGTRVGS